MAASDPLADFMLKAYRPTMRVIFSLFALALANCGSVGSSAPVIPAEVVKSLPSGYSVFDAATISVAHSSRQFYIFVALRHDDPLQTSGSEEAPNRLLLIFEEMTDGSFEPFGRNDHTVYRSDEGGQCDPFGLGRITTARSLFTVENSVACGQHWTNSTTFRFNAHVNAFVFDNQRFEEWFFNPDNDPSADVLISGGQHIDWSVEGQIVRFSDWGNP